MGVRAGRLAGFIVWSLAIAAACSGKDPLPPAIDCWDGSGTPGDGEVQLGTGDTAFDPMVDEQEVEVHRGIQGLVHIFLRARVRGLDEGNEDDMNTQPYTLFSGHFENGDPIGLFECAMRLPYPIESDPDYLMLDGPRAFVLNEDAVDTIVGQRVLLRVDVLDIEGRYATDEHWVRAYGAPGEFPADAGPSTADAGLGSL